MFGDIFKFAAPIAAGAIAGPAGFQLAGSAMAGSIAAGAATGAGIAALSGDDVLTGAVTGGLGGMGGGSLANAATLTGQQAATNFVNPALKSSVAGGASAGSFNPALITQGGQGITPEIAAQQVAQTATPTLGEGIKASIDNPGAFLENLGDGSKAMGAGKVGIMGLGAANSVGAFTPELPEYDDNPMNKYDPKRRLDLSMDTGINNALRRDTGLRLLAEGGEVKDRSYYGIEPQYAPQSPVYPGLGMQQQDPVRVPVTGFVDVGGKFKADPKGDITDIEYEKRFSYVTEGTKKSEDSDGGDMEGIDKAAKSGTGVNPALAIQAAQGYAESQQSPVRDQALGLKDLQAGGYLETGGRVGDGMSDGIPAIIDGEQPARLSDGEFVIPADVVSHLGNGSSDAGAQKLYGMMDKVRKARTGNEKQGKEIEPERYMPA